MQTIIYQGREVQATLVNYLSGTIPTSTVDADGDEELFRDAAGCYYLRRKLGLLADYHEDSGEGNIEASGRTHVHRINVNAAILWATTRLNSETLALRQDAADLLMEGRTYRDPYPSHLSAEQRAMVSDPERFAKQCEPAAGSGRITVELDDLASAMLRKVCRQGSAARHPGEDLRDLVNAAVTFALCDDSNDQYGEFDLNQSDDALARAKRDRLALEADTPTGPTADPEPVQVQPSVHRFTFDYPATEKVCGRQRTVEVTDEQMARVGELAAIFSLTPSQFLRGLADYNDLPGQPRRGSKLRDSLQAQHVAFVCMDETMAKRIERTAQAREQTADEFVADAVSGDVDMWEEAMLLHPITGELLEAECENLYTEVDYTYVVPPVGHEHELQFKTHPGRKYVRFGAYLTPAQLERLEFPHMVTDCAADQEVKTLLIPFDEEGSPFLEVGGKRVQAAEAIVEAEEEAA